MPERNVPIDAVRGIAVLWMQFFHILDFFSSSLHLYGSFWLTSGLNQLNWMPLFFVTAGICLGMPRKLNRIARRSIIDMILGLLLCLWIFSLDADVIFILGLYSLMSVPLINVLRNRESKIQIGVVLTVVVFSFLVTSLLRQNQIYIYPFSFGFTLWISLPFIFWGYYLSKNVINNDSRTILSLALALAPFAVVSTLFSPIDFYEQTLSFVALSSVAVALVYVLVVQVRTARIVRALAFFGQNALYYFVFSWAVLYKILDVSGTLRSLDLLPSLALTVTLMVLFSLLVAGIPWHMLQRLKNEGKKQPLKSGHALWRFFIHRYYYPEETDNTRSG